MTRMTLPELVGMPASACHDAEVRGAPGIASLREVRDTMSDPEVHLPTSRGATLERGRQDVLDAARPLPPDEDAIIEDLGDDEDRLFLAAILNM
jgi:hypothetical protein